MVKILNNIKQSVGEFIFNRKLKNLKRYKKLINLNEARSIGIVYNVNSQTIFNKVKKLTKELTTRQRQVMPIGFVNRRSIPNYCIAPNSGYYFNQRDLNWYGGPRNDYVKEFINKEFDILIDLNMENEYILRYISGLSKSKLKVGSYSKINENYFDFMIKTDKSLSIDIFMEHALHYLLILKSK